jgi:hypothetical protein
MSGRRSTLVAALMAAGTLAAASTAQAAERQCAGVIGPETVHDDLVVPAGLVCDLAGTRVLGNTRVEESAELYAEQAELAGNVDAAPGGYVDLFETTVAGTVRLNDSLGLSAESGSVGNIDSRAADFIDLFGARVVGNVKVTGPGTAVFGEALDVGGNLEATGADYFDLYDSLVNGTFRVRDNDSGSIFCGNTLNGNSEFTNNRTLLTIGSPDQACDGNRLNGNVLVQGNTSETEISDNDVGGNLTCRRNAPPPVGGGNRVEGNKEGQCRAL